MAACPPSSVSVALSFNIHRSTPRLPYNRSPHLIQNTQGQQRRRHRRCFIDAEGHADQLCKCIDMRHLVSRAAVGTALGRLPDLQLSSIQMSLQLTALSGVTQGTGQTGADDESSTNDSCSFVQKSSSSTYFIVWLSTTLRGSHCGTESFCPAPSCCCCCCCCHSC